MRALASLLLIIALLPATMSKPQAQKPQPQREECATVVTAEQMKVERERAARGYAPLAPDFNRPYHVPLTIHIVRHTDQTGGFTLDELDIAMRDLNRLWQPYGIQFYQLKGVIYIDSDYYFNVPDDDARRDELRSVLPVANTINVYFTNLAGNLCGQARFTSDATQGVLINAANTDNDCAGVAKNPSSLAHEIGHVFDLYHTHETMFGTECPSETNCGSAGDLLCDTPADPNLSGRIIAGGCTYDNSAALPTSCDMTAYAPLTNNLMSYSDKTCRDSFTSSQSSKALNILTTAENRKNLINVAKYVAPGGSASSNCTYQDPCGTVARAVDVANPGDHIFILPGSYPVITINKAVVLEKWSTDAGTVTIGQ